jgi:hypothetical protein
VQGASRGVIGIHGPNPQAYPHSKQGAGS